MSDTIVNLLDIQERLSKGGSKRLPPNAPDANHAARRLVELYSRWKKPEKAAEWPMPLESREEKK